MPKRAGLSNPAARQHDRGTGIVVRKFQGSLGNRRTSQRYHTLAPDTFRWTHVTFFAVILDFNERSTYKKFTAAQKDQVVREAVTWWHCHGLTARPAFDDYASFQTCREDMLDNQLINTQTTQWSSRISEHRIAPAPGIPPWIWKIIGRPATVAAHWLAKALMPEKTRETLEREWTARDQRIYTWFARAMTTTDRFWHLLPSRLRYAPRAYAGIRKQDL